MWDDFVDSVYRAGYIAWMVVWFSCAAAFGFLVWLLCLVSPWLLLLLVLLLVVYCWYRAISNYREMQRGK